MLHQTALPSRTPTKPRNTIPHRLLPEVTIAFTIYLSGFPLGSELLSKEKFSLGLMFNQSEWSETCGLLLYKDLHHNETDRENLKDRRRKKERKSLDFNGTPHPSFLFHFYELACTNASVVGKSVTSHVPSWIRWNLSYYTILYICIMSTKGRSQGPLPFPPAHALGLMAVSSDSPESLANVRSVGMPFGGRQPTR